MLRKKELLVLLPIVAIMIAAGAAFHHFARQAAEQAAVRRLKASAQLTSELLAGHTKSLDSILQATLTQEALSNFLMFRDAGLLDDAERQRHALEQSLLKVTGQDPAIVELSLFDHRANRFVGIEHGHRTLRPASAAGQTRLFEPMRENTCTRFVGDNRLEVWRTWRNAAGQPLAVAKITYQLDAMAKAATSFAMRHLQQCEIRLVDEQGTIRYRRMSGSQPVVPLQAAVALNEPDGTIVIIQAERQALASFYHSEITLFAALGGVTLLLIAMTAVGTRYVTRELRQNARQLELQSEQLRRSKKEAEAASEAKTSFLANMSHEIRTPMTAILGFSELLRNDHLEPAEARDCLDTVLRNGQHLLSLINQILDLTKIESGKLEIEVTPCSPTALLDDLERLFRPEAEDKGIALQRTIDGPLPELIQTDPTRLKQALVNLIGNAIKFTDAGRVEVRVRCDWGAQRLVFEVADTGIGMSQAQIERVFHAFLQADNSTTRRYGGTGLGLSITRQIADLLGGEIRLQSEPARGSTFTLIVPTGDLVTRETVTASPASPVPLGPPALDPDSADRRPRVLLVEDGPDNQRLLSRILSTAGVESAIVANGLEGYQAALSALRTGRPYDLVLMDLQMPVMDGYEATAELRSAGYGGQIVALTAHALRSDVERCLASGFDGYLAKPIECEKLLEEVNLRINQSRRSRIGEVGFGQQACGAAL